MSAVSAGSTYSITSPQTSGIELALEATHKLPNQADSPTGRPQPSTWLGKTENRQGLYSHASTWSEGPSTTRTNRASTVSLCNRERSSAPPTLPYMPANNSNGVLSPDSPIRRRHVCSREIPFFLASIVPAASTNSRFASSVSCGGRGTSALRSKPTNSCASLVT